MAKIDNFEIDTIYNEDCLEGMKRIPDKSIDLIVTDPPYELKNNGKGKGAFGRDKRDYFNALDPISRGISDEVLEQMLRVCKKPNMYLFCSKEQLPQLLNFAIANKLSYDILTWHKTNPTPTCNNKYLSDTEYIVFMRKGANLYGTYETKSKYFITECNTKDKDLYIHPTIKPTSIIRTLIINSSKEGEIVLDPYIGSGTTAVACNEEKRHYVGFEISKQYFDIAVRRVADEKAQLSLF